MTEIKEENGRSGGIRTHDPLTPSQVRYRAALRSEPRKPLYNQRLERKRENAAWIEKGTNGVEKYAWELKVRRDFRKLTAWRRTCDATMDIESSRHSRATGCLQVPMLPDEEITDRPSVYRTFTKTRSRRSKLAA